MESKSIEEYRVEGCKDVDVNPTNLANYSLSVGFKRIKWANYYRIENGKLDIYKNELDEVYKNRFKYYTYEYELNIEKKNIDVFIKGDSEYINAKLKVQAQEGKTNFIKSIYETLCEISFLLNVAEKNIEYLAGN